jgi:branched-chain amino acid transport system ATP-binding protein
MTLRVSKLRAWYGATQALFDVFFEIPHGQTLALVGTNGAGKTTTVNAIAGIVYASGEIEFDGHRLDQIQAYERARVGLGLVPERRGLFWSLTVEENLDVGRGPKGGASIDTALAMFPRLASRINARASDLSGGEQQMLAIARALMRRPRLLMLDEPSLGLAPAVVDDVYDRLSLLKSSGLTILLVEQSIPRAQRFADRLCLLRNGMTAMNVEATDLKSVEALAAIALGEHQVSSSGTTGHV